MRARVVPSDAAGGIMPHPLRGTEMLHTALLLITCLQEPDLSTPEKAFAAWKGIMERLHKSEALLRKNYFGIGK